MGDPFSHHLHVLFIGYRGGCRSYAAESVLCHIVVSDYAHEFIDCRLFARRKMLVDHHLIFVVVELDHIAVEHIFHVGDAGKLAVGLCDVDRFEVSHRIVGGVAEEPVDVGSGVAREFVGVDIFLQFIDHVYSR